MIIIYALHFIYLWFVATYSRKEMVYGSFKQAKTYQHYYHQPKPKRVKKKVIKLKALMPQAGCRTIAHTFKRLHQHKGMMVKAM